MARRYIGIGEEIGTSGAHHRVVIARRSGKEPRGPPREINEICSPEQPMELHQAYLVRNESAPRSSEICAPCRVGDISTGRLPSHVLEDMHRSACVPQNFFRRHTDSVWIAPLTYIRCKFNLFLYQTFCLLFVCRTQAHELLAQANCSKLPVAEFSLWDGGERDGSSKFSTFQSSNELPSPRKIEPPLFISFEGLILSSIFVQRNKSCGNEAHLGFS